MRIEWAIPCLEAEVAGGRADIRAAGADMFDFASLPAPVEFTVLLNLKGLEMDFIEPVDVAVLLHRAGSEDVGLFAFTHRGGRAPGHRPGWEVTNLVPIKVGVAAERAGDYALDFYLDGRYRTSVPFVVDVSA